VLSRVALRDFLDDAGLREHVRVPEDGEVCTFPGRKAGLAA
jgi:hypothetical protein